MAARLEAADQSATIVAFPSGTLATVGQLVSKCRTRPEHSPSQAPVLGVEGLGFGRDPSSLVETGGNRQSHDRR